MSNVPDRHAVQVKELPDVLDLLDEFQQPDPTVDQDAMADRTHFLFHLWPAEFPVFGRELGFATLRPGFVHPCFSRPYLTRHHGRTGEHDLMTAPAVEHSKSLAGYAVKCVMDTLRQPYGVVSLDPFTTAEWGWPDVKAWQSLVLPRPFDPEQFPVFDQYAHRHKYLVEQRRQLGESPESAALKLILWSNDQAREKLREWARARIDSAAAAAQTGKGKVHANDTELDWMMLAGLGIPKFMAEFSERTDLRLTDEKPTPQADTGAAVAIQASVEAINDMRQIFALQMEQLRAQQPPADDEVRAMREEMAAMRAEMKAMADRRGPGRPPNSSKEA